MRPGFRATARTRAVHGRAALRRGCTDDEEEDYERGARDRPAGRRPARARELRARERACRGTRRRASRACRGRGHGHAHVVTGRTRLLAEQRRFYNTTRPGRTFLVIEDAEPAVLEHEEHLPITLEPGSDEIRRQREYLPFGASRVAD